MKRWIITSLLVCTITFAHVTMEGQTASPVYSVHGPTIVAFFPVTDSDLKSADTNEALSDFQLYASQVAVPLQKRGIEFHQTNAQSFRLQLQSGKHVFRPKKNSCGYYFIAPGKMPHVDYGVMTDGDILREATKYL